MEINKSAAQKGSLKISEDVIITVAKQAALDVAGVAGFSDGEFSIKRFIVKSNPVSPIKMTMNADSAQIDLYVNLLYGYAQAAQIKNIVLEQCDVEAENISIVEVN